MLGVTLHEKHCLPCIDSKKLPGFRIGELGMNALPSAYRSNVDESGELGVHGGVSEVHLEQRLDQVGWHPNVINGKGRSVDQAKSPQVEELLPSGKFEVFGNSVILHTFESEHFTVLPVTLILDRAEQAVQRPDALLECYWLHVTAATALTLQNAGVLKFAECLAHRVPTDSVMRHELTIGRKP